MSRLTPDMLLRAYCTGIFPMGETREDPTLYWVDPDERAIIELDRFHLPRRLARTVRNGPFEVSCDRDFAGVIKACAAPRPRQRQSWINQPIVDLYTALFDRGFAHSVECRIDDELIGGLYGVSINGAFFGESMFSRARDASKVALVHLVARLVKGGFRLLDCQFMTDHLRQFGTVEIGRSEYRTRLGEALATPATFYLELGGAEACETLAQATTHTS
ncbi:leucyl/phenylalanyl-tRNA--protein transferase [Reyranella sp. CPCC 100927]|uniref:leucyl/phenylalanyl-tRNA--protein transferase n=1 Tax=Reyranella sp. CPCC 100927 TaxID=2599616 RepID=UPI0011B75638|nr:leucyl/phenylalanyl-tRNA--protein transferase [Reyranella sp. CPCC 100927]TWT00737.1 leucyl/phenylalanyl-tRNA--protein transferase [Reyranella sp. CPCC 100927]